MSARQTERSSTSIARRIARGFWWRRLVRWAVVDMLFAGMAFIALWTGYAQNLQVRTYILDFIPWPKGGLGIYLDPVNYFPLNIRLIVHLSGGDVTLPLGLDLMSLWPFVAPLLAVEGISLLGYFSDVRRVRRRLQPLNELALHAESLGSKGIMDANNIESLEQAIERASVDSPQVSTGVDDLASIEVALNGLLRQMQEAKLQQIRFVSDASHELRTPIAVIQGYANMLDRWGKDDPAVLEESIAALKSEGAHMQELVEQLLYLARSDSGRNSLELQEFNLAALAAEVASESALIDPSHVYELGFDATEACEDEHYLLVADRALVKQSMRAIVQNAARYSVAGTTVLIGVLQDPDSVSFKVQDAGIGMSPEEATHVFERFWRSDAARDVSKEGSGLGLSIARQIVEDHGGVIEILSHEGIGSRFTIRLPRARDVSEVD